MTRTLVALIATLLVLPASASAATFPVGHTVKRMTVPGTTRERGPGGRRAPLVSGRRRLVRGRAAPTVYRSALYGDTRIPAGWKPLSWSLNARLAREATVSLQGKAFPVIVFSTGNQNDPIDYAYTLEAIAAGGFVVAAPYHADNTGDDVRIDFINEQAGIAADPLQRRPAAAGDVRSRRLLEGQRAEQHRRPRPGHLIHAERAPGVARQPRRRRAGGRLRALARHAHRTHRRGREHGVGRRA